MIDDIAKDVESSWKNSVKEANKLYKSGELRYWSYEYRTLRAKSEEWDLLWDSLGTLESKIKGIKECMELHKWDIGMYQNKHRDHGWDGDSGYYNIKVYWYELVDIDDLKNTMQWEVKNRIAKIVYDDVKDRYTPAPSWTRDISCKMIELFQNDAIDYETMVELTYTDCKLFK